MAHKKEVISAGELRTIVIAWTDPAATPAATLTTATTVATRGPTTDTPTTVAGVSVSDPFEAPEDTEPQFDEEDDYAPCLRCGDVLRIHAMEGRPGSWLCEACGAKTEEE